MPIEISHPIDAPRTDVWSELSDLSSHAEWMKDAVSIEFLSDTTSGVGTRMLVPTRVGPLRTEDVIEVVGWEEGTSIAVDHRGLVTGTGEFRLEGDSPTIVVWRETLAFPWWLGGRITAALAGPVLRWIWAGNLRRFAERVVAGR